IMPIFESFSKIMAKEVGGKEMRHVKCVEHASSVRLYSLLLEKKRAKFWSQDEELTEISLLDILEPSSSLPEPDVKGPLTFSDTVLKRMKLAVNVGAVVDTNISVAASESQNSTLQYQIVTIPPPKFEELRKRKLLKPLPPYLKQYQRAQKNLYVVTKTVQLLNSPVLSDSSSGGFSGSFSFPWNLASKVKGEGEGQTSREMMLTLEKGMVLAYKKKLLVFENNGWSNPVQACETPAQSQTRNETPCHAGGIQLLLSSVTSFQWTVPNTHLGSDTWCLAKGEGEAQTLRERRLTLEKGMVMAYKKILLVFEIDGWLPMLDPFGPARSLMAAPQAGCGHALVGASGLRHEACRWTFHHVTLQPPGKLVGLGEDMREETQDRETRAEDTTLQEEEGGADPSPPGRSLVESVAPTGADPRAFSASDPEVQSFHDITNDKQKSFPEFFSSRSLEMRYGPAEPILPIGLFPLVSFMGSVLCNHFSLVEPRLRLVNITWAMKPLGKLVGLRVDMREETQDRETWAEDTALQEEEGEQTPSSPPSGRSLVESVAPMGADPRAFSASDPEVQSFHDITNDDRKSFPEDFKCLENEIVQIVRNVVWPSRNVPHVMFINIQAMLGDQQALQDLMDMLKQGKTSCHSNGPGATILSELGRIQEYPYVASVKLILYLLEAIMVLNDTQHALLAWSMERRILLHQWNVVLSILKPNFKYPWSIPFTLNPQLLAPLQGEGLAVTYGLLQECGLRVEPSNPRSTWDLEAKEPLSALLAALTILHWMAEA
ncbi:Gasdermin-C, partial [Galemys pyrenaicus]